ncbi:hypothetical protein X534_gp01 [Ralstonia phage RSB3]|uniref:Uncharacterized protein n=1 Tax=Ralstonia phage RSB3 TaxID=1402875 RepID=U3TFK6_9CAUD|nr:hypothetical protein X534_gp01 [Ralstonia phage RSB3]BAN92312.1 hypothetical protein [Ralstonia phage RSB3]
MAKAQAVAQPEVKRMALISGAAPLTKLIVSIGKRAAKLDQEIHLAAVSVIVHTAKHNDPDISTKLVDAMGKTMRKQALIQWMLAYGAFKLDEKGALVYDVKRKEAVLADENIAAAEAEPFWDYTPEPKYVQFDLAKALAALMKKAEKALSSPEQDAALVSPEKLAALRAMVEPAQE